VQPKRELLESKSKEKQGKVLAFPWIPLVESGLFNGLQRKKIKKSLRLPTRVSGCLETSLGLFSALLHALPVAADCLPRSKDFSRRYRMDSGFSQGFVCRPKPRRREKSSPAKCLATIRGAGRRQWSNSVAPRSFARLAGESPDASDSPLVLSRVH
jgi:hypothetical protein